MKLSKTQLKALDLIKQTLVNNIILEEWKLSLKGKQYIEDASNAIKFIGHLVYLITDGKDGEKCRCIEKNYE